MGLDMSLYGVSKREGMTHTCDLAYWRKHPNLHGLIVRWFADGVDECQQIPLSRADLFQIINLVENGNLPNVTGFFFGASDGSVEERVTDVFQLRVAIEHLDEDPANTVYYQASW